MNNTWRNVLYVVVQSEMAGGWNHWPFHAVDVRDQETALCGLKPSDGWGVKLSTSPGSMAICGRCADIERPGSFRSAAQEAAHA